MTRDTILRIEAWYGKSSSRVFENMLKTTRHVPARGREHHKKRILWKRIRGTPHKNHSNQVLIRKNHDIERGSNPWEVLQSRRLLEQIAILALRLSRMRAMSSTWILSSVMIPTSFCFAIHFECKRTNPSFRKRCNHFTCLERQISDSWIYKWQT